jgi:hypothetical protein
LNIERTGKFDLTKRWDVGMLILKDCRTLKPVAIYEASRAVLEAEIRREGTDVVRARARAKATGKRYKAPRRQDGALFVRDFQRLAKQVWPLA